MRILIVRLSSIGDVAHTIPLASALASEGHTVGWAVELPASPLVHLVRGVRNVFLVPRARSWSLVDRWNASKRLREFKADVAIDAQGLWKSAFWTRVSGAPRRLGWPAGERREPSSARLITEHVTGGTARGEEHMVDRHLALARPLLRKPLKRSEVQPQFEIPEAATEIALNIERTFRGDSRGLALIAPGGGWRNKLYPADRWAQVARGLRERSLVPLVLWGPGETDLADEIVSLSSDAAVRSPATSLVELVALASRATVLLAADTGPLHVACLMGTPVVGIFGPTDPKRNGPWSDKDEVVRRTPTCAPCHKRECETHDGIMATIPASEVLSAVDRRLSTQQ